MMAQRSVVIVVDDDPSLLKSVARLSAHHGIDSRTFASAAALLHSDCFEAVTGLLDINLGGISGTELQRRLVASGSKLPTILMTANDDKATRNEAIGARCIAYCESRSRSMSAVRQLESCGLALATKNTRDGRWATSLHLTPSRTGCSEDLRDPSPLQWTHTWTLPPGCLVLPSPMASPP
jgi:DNA-binding NtrC family response regulator